MGTGTGETGADSPSLRDLLARRVAGLSLLRPLYVGKETYARDIELIFKREWLFAAPLAAFRRAGDYVTLDLDGGPLLFIRGNDGQVRGFHNVCRHRGSKVVGNESGRARGKLVCPYHQWMYEFDGTFAHASHMPEQPPAEQFGLAPVRTEVLGAGVHFCLADEPPPIAEAKAQIDRHTRAYAPGRMRIATAKTYRVDANWKLMLENNRECGHCRGAHPELMACVYDYGVGDDTRGGDDGDYVAQTGAMVAECERLGIPHRTVSFPGDSFHRLARLPFRKGYLSETVQPGALASPVPLGEATPPTGQLRTIYLPNAWGHYLPDYYVATRVLPLGPRSTRVDVYWMVHEDAGDGQIDFPALTEVWDRTTLQDGDLVANNQAGVNSDAYVPGPYSPVTETMVEHFADWYVRRMRERLGDGA